MNFFKTLVAASAVTLMAGAASAATCTVGSVTYGLTQDGGDPASTTCDTGNDKGAGGFGTLNGWDLADEVDWTNGDTPDSGFDLVISGNTWSVTGGDGYDAIAVALKQANSFAFFVLDLTKALTGTWSITGPGDASQVYSHIAGWTKGTPSEVPLPASALLLIGGMGGLAMLRRRRK